MDFFGFLVDFWARKRYYEQNLLMVGTEKDLWKMLPSDDQSFFDIVQVAFSDVLNLKGNRKEDLDVTILRDSENDPQVRFLWSNNGLDRSVDVQIAEDKGGKQTVVIRVQAWTVDLKAGEKGVQIWNSEEMQAFLLDKIKPAAFSSALSKAFLEVSSWKENKLGAELFFDKQEGPAIDPHSVLLSLSTRIA